MGWARPAAAELFGNASRRYPDHYRPNPASRRYVQHLRLYYAQSHPMEDFAETFAVVLGSRSGGWRKRYADWPALQETRVRRKSCWNVSEGSRSRHRSRRQPDSLSTLNITLREYYADKRKPLHGQLSRYLRSRSEAPLFGRSQALPPALASRFLRRNRSEIRRLVSNWTGEYQFTLDQVLSDMIGRSRELKLRAVGPERRLKMEFAVLLTVKTMDFHYSRRNWFAL